VIMICLARPPVWICCVEFVPASSAEFAGGFLGHVSCHVRGTLRLRPMRVRLLSNGCLKIKVRRGGVDQIVGVVSIDDETRWRVYELILADPAFRAGMAAIGMRPGEEQQ